MPILVAVVEAKRYAVGQSRVRVNVREDREELGEAVTAGPQAAAILCGEVGEAAAPALPALERRLDDNNSLTRVLAAQAIWRISHDPKKSLPALMAALDSAGAPGSASGSGADLELISAIEALEAMGPAAKAAIPSIERVRTFSMAARHAANRALRALNEAQPRDVQPGR
jgi:hypothetical protein